jgi:hypothetical protein
MKLNESILLFKKITRLYTPYSIPQASRATRFHFIKKLDVSNILVLHFPRLS